MTPAGTLLREEILHRGPVSFERFMEVALYHPEHGYYRNQRDPFGRHGDFYTAEQLQPVYGILIAALIRELYRKMERPDNFTVVEMGPGRGEMASAFSEWPYVPVDLSGKIPDRFSGVVFANEFFDALPVDVPGRRVGWDGSRFVWAPADGSWREVNRRALRVLDELAARLTSGYLMIVDYGYTEAELVRHPEGTLMSYRRHQASPDVLCEPGERDITAHVDFTAIERHATAGGWRIERFETLSSALLRAGEMGAFEEALRAEGTEAVRRRGQLKTLLYSMGEVFRMLVLRKVDTK